MSWKIPLRPFKTAITRIKLSAPTSYLVKNKLIQGELLDYGCGHGRDGINLGGDLYDPHFYPENKEYVFSKLYDTIICNYVLNVISGPEQLKVIDCIISLLKASGTAYISVRRDIKGTTYTRIGTMQTEVILYFNTVIKTRGYEIYKVRKNDKAN